MNRIAFSKRMLSLIVLGSCSAVSNAQQTQHAQLSEQLTVDVGFSGGSATVTISPTYRFVFTTWTTLGGSSQGYPIVQGKNVQTSYNVNYGKFHVNGQYYNDAGAPVAFFWLRCGDGNTIRFSVINHGNNCNAFNDAIFSVLVNRTN